MSKNKWEEIYGATSGKVHDLIAKQAAQKEKRRAKNKNKGKQQGGGSGNKRFKLGHVI